MVRVLEAEGKPRLICPISAHLRWDAGVADYAAYNVLEDPELREGIKKFRRVSTVLTAALSCHI